MGRPLPRIEALHLADVTLPPAHPLGGGACPVFAFVILHARGAVLVDTGVGRHEGIDRLYRPVRRPLTEALRGAGQKPGDISAVVNTHLHFDHCGENALFAGIPIYVQRREYEAAREPLYTVEEHVNAPGLVYEQVDGEREIADGVRLVPTPGHTLGHESIVVESGDGPAIIVGQAAYTAAEFAGEAAAQAQGATGASDATAYRASLEMLRGLGPRRAYFSHDPTVWRRDT